MPAVTIKIKRLRKTLYAFIAPPKGKEKEFSSNKIKSKKQEIPGKSMSKGREKSISPLATEM